MPRRVHPRRAATGQRLRWLHGLALLVPLLAAAQSADMSITVSDAPDPVVSGGLITYTVSVGNNGPDSGAVTVDVPPNGAIPAPLLFTSLTVPAGWVCGTPAVGSSGPLNCITPNLPAGSTSIATLVMRLNPEYAGAAFSTRFALLAFQPDPVIFNSVQTVTTTALPQADLSISLGGGVLPATAPGTQVPVNIDVVNAGPGAPDTNWTTVLPAGLGFASITAPAGWVCTTPAVGSAGTVRCDRTAFPASTAPFVLQVTPQPAVAGSTVALTFNVASAFNDPVPASNSANTTLAVTAAPVALSAAGVPTMGHAALAMLAAAVAMVAARRLRGRPTPPPPR